jgi:hypothetical protein
MDRSFLSQPAVIEASRRFVCVRLATYENAAEAKFLEAICPTGSGRLENTVFTILSPDGKRQLSQASRSTREVFDNAGDMTRAMNRIAAWYRPKAADIIPDLPTVASVRLAINVAACDDQPLIVVIGKSARARGQLIARLKPLAWSEEFRGRFVYVTASQTKEIETIADAGVDDAVLVVQPDRFGLKGSVLTACRGKANSEDLAACLRQGIVQYSRRDETFQDHVHEGRLEGVFWQTAIPVTDPMERRARQQTKANSTVY